MALTKRARAAREVRRKQMLARFRQAELSPVPVLAVLLSLLTFGLVTAAL